MGRHLLPGNVQGEYNTLDETTISEARHLLRHTYGDDEGYIAIFSGVRVEGDKRLRYTREKFFKYPEELTAAIGHAGDCAREYGREVYYCTHLLTEERRKKEHAAPITCLYAEIDGDVELHKVAKRYATAIVESSPGRYHIYIRLTHAVTPEEAEHLNKRFARTVGADPSGADLTQLLRVPGTPNNKYTDKPPVQLRRLRDAAHDPDTLAQVLAPLPRNDTHAPIREARTPITLEDVELLEKARNARNGAGERFRKLYDQGDFHDFPSQSEADLDLHRMLAFWTAWDRERVERLFRDSALMREKYNRTNYREPTISAAIAATRRAYQQPASVDSSLGEAIESLRAQGGRLAWEGRSGPTDRHAYDALIERAETYGTLKEKSIVVSMDVRALALASGVSKPTAQKALERLQADRKLIRCIDKGIGTRAATYAILLPAQNLNTNHFSCGGYVQPLRALRNPTPQTEKEFDKNGRRINHPQQYLLGRIGKGAALVLERVLAAGESGVTLRDVARSLARRPRDVRRRTVHKLLEANLITCEGDEELLRVAENFDYLLEQELLESGCIAAKERDRERYAIAAANWRRFLANGNPPDEAPTEEELQKERDAQVERALIAFQDERSGPGLTFLNYRDGNTKTFEYLVGAVAHYYNSSPELWRQPVKRAYEIAVNGKGV